MTNKYLHQFESTINKLMEDAKKKADLADESLIRFWGKPLSNSDVLTCCSWGFAEVEPQKHKSIYILSNRAKRFPGQVHINGAVMKPCVDSAIEEWAALNLDFCFGEEGEELQTALTLIHLTLEKVITYEMKHGRPTFTSTAKL